MVVAKQFTIKIFMKIIESLKCNFCQKWWSAAQFFLGVLRNFNYFSKNPNNHIIDVVVAKQFTIKIFMTKIESLNCNFCRKWQSTVQFFFG